MRIPMARYTHLWGIYLFCAFGLLSCQQPLVGPEEKAPFVFPYDSLKGSFYLTYFENNKSPGQSVGFLADGERQEAVLIEASERAYLRRDNQLWLGKYAGDSDSAFYQYTRFDQDLETYISDNELYTGVPVGITGNDSIHALLLRVDTVTFRFEIHWLIHDLSQQKTYVHQVISLPENSSVGYEALGQSVVFSGGQKLLLRTGDLYLICDGTTSQEIILQGENGYWQHALSIDPSGQMLAYIRLYSVPNEWRYISYLHFLDLASGTDRSYEMPESSFFHASAWSPYREPRLLLAGKLGLLEVDTQTGEYQQRITFPQGSKTIFTSDFYWNP